MEKQRQSIIKNWEQLDTSDLRKRALDIAEAGFLAMDRSRAILKFLVYNGRKQKLKVKNREFNLGKFKRIFLVNFGGDFNISLGAVKTVLNNRSLEVISLSQNSEFPEMFKDDFVLCLILEPCSGPESSVISALRANGADDVEISLVNKRLEKFQGGNLAKLIYPATCLSLIFSGKNNDISAVAGGMTLKDAATNIQTQAVLKKYNILEKLSINSLKLSETPKEDKYFKNVGNILALSPESFFQAAREKAEELDFGVEVSGAENLLKSIQSLKKRQCLLSPGGSNETVLKVLPDLPENKVVIFCSDGRGVIADQSTLVRARALGLEPKDYSENNTADKFFESLGQQIEVEAEVAVGGFTICIG